MAPTRSRHVALRSVLALAGLIVILIGLNVAMGGIQTLGWQVEPGFVSVADAYAFGVQDNHVRFLGGFWLGAGLIFMVSGRWLAALKPGLIVIIAMIFVGGLARLLSVDSDILLSPDVLQSILFELVGFPLLGLWLYRTDLPD